ncbi:MAG TPA: DMT family transporter [Rhodoglobus sp.]|nr:DMT family transporter [Rhodoglobus sp.]HOT34976.1 DMT family transporter [Rhodoglobus sp.]HPU04068.1 DMT family transporter [Rhodoglobus sp.]HQA23617.1 DMT family transporter [Rhodoglobus sp.]HQE46112.1 DMT family transporter [Rhodoglobus sp.]
MTHRSTTRGLILGVLASMSFGTSGAFIKPLLEGGWSPAAAVTIRAGIAGLVLLPIAVIALRGRWAALWRARWRVIGMGLIGVAGTQLAYFAAISRIPVSTSLLIEYLAPLILVAIVWIRTRRTPRAVVLIGSVLAVGGLVLIIGPGAIAATDGLGIVFALIAMLGVVGYYLIAARPSNGLPTVAFAASGLLLGSLTLGVIGGLGLLPLAADFGTVPMGGAEVPWWVPLSFVALVGTAFAYVASIAASEMLGSRLMSFVGLLEVVFAGLFAWLLIGENISLVQGLGGLLILGGIALVRMEREADAPLEPGSVDEDAGLVSRRGTAATRPAEGA